ncbi:MAG: type II secretion system F family protein [Anaerolineae bacterium]|nr:type II secretion system F family protein [Anaerolineae bacterium]
MRIGLIAALVGAMAVVALFAGIYSVADRPDDVTSRLEVYAAVSHGDSGQRRQRGHGGLRAVLGRVDRLLTGRGMAQRLALMLAQASLRMTVPEFLVIEMSAAVVGGCVGFILRGYLVTAVACAALGAALPLIFVARRRGKRIKSFHDQLVDVLSLVVGSIRGGHALPTALDLVSKELSPPASEEFAHVLREMGLGLTQTEALNNLVKRMESGDLQLVVTAVNISHEVGGNLSLVLDKIAETIRERIRLQGEIRVLTTQQRLTSYLLVALPFVLAMVLALINPDWIMRMFAPGWVRIIPVFATVSVLIGFVITQKLTKIEV